jgi:HrpA-like RNA helicase
MGLYTKKLPRLGLPVEARLRDDPSLLVGSHYVLQSDTGSGKSTYVPFALARKAPVIAVVPRREIAHGVSTYMRSFVGTIVGVVTSQRVSTPRDMSVVYITTGVAIRWLPWLRDSNHTVVLDEFHEDNVDMDFIYSALRGRSGSLILMTATPNSRTEGMNIRYVGGRTPQPVVKQDVKEVLKPNHVVMYHRKRTLVFLPGRAEIRRFSGELKMPVHIWTASTEPPP